MINKNIYLSLFALTIASCSHLGPKPQQTKTASLRTVPDIIKREKKIEREVASSHIESPAQEVKAIKVSTSRSNEGFKLNYRQKHFDFWKKYFAYKERARFTRHLNNGLQYKKIVESTFKEHGLPPELFYVGLIESGYNTHIKSHASAVGPWQFIKGTATRYGLRVDSAVDERRSIYKSSVAAANYFKDLYNIFGSWELALCAYNAGEYRIINAIRKGNTRDYVELVKKKLIPKETIFYIPKVAAAKHLVETEFAHLKDHKLAGFYQDVRPVLIGKSFSASQVRKGARLSRKEFKRLNPEFKRDWIRVRRKQTVYVPTRLFQVANHFVKSSGKLYKAKPAQRVFASSSSSSSSSSRFHIVRRGESLARISKKYGKSVAHLKKLNKIRGSNIYPGQKIKVTGARSLASTKDKFHKVRSGEYLGKIARKYGMSLRTLKKLNGLRSNNIKVGQRLLVKKSAAKKFYIVRKGDNLYRIAKRFGTSVKKLVRLNSLSGKKIYPRQKILIPLNS